MAKRKRTRTRFPSGSTQGPRASVSPHLRASNDYQSFHRWSWGASGKARWGGRGTAPPLPRVRGSAESLGGSADPCAAPQTPWAAPTDPWAALPNGRLRRPHGRIRRPHGLIRRPHVRLPAPPGWQPRARLSQRSRYGQCWTDLHPNHRASPGHPTCCDGTAQPRGGNPETHNGQHMIPSRDFNFCLPIGI